MDTPHTHEEIAPLANALWVTQGRPADKADEHWKLAEAHLQFNLQADAASQEHKLLSDPVAAQSFQIVRRYRVTTVKDQPEEIDAVSVDDSDPVTIRFTCANGSVRSFGRGVFLSFEEIDNASADRS